MYRAFLSTMAAEKLKVVVFLGSTRDGRLGERVGKFVMNSLKDTHDLILLGKFNLLHPAILTYLCKCILEYN